MGKPMHSGWEHRKTGRVFSHSSDIDHHITNEVFSNQQTITTMHKEDRGCIYIYRFEIKNESVDCEMYTKHFARNFILRYVGKHPCSSHDDQLEALHVPFDVNRRSLPGLTFWSDLL